MERNLIISSEYSYTHYPSYTLCPLQKGRIDFAVFSRTWSWKFCKASTPSFQEGFLSFPLTSSLFLSPTVFS